MTARMTIYVTARTAQAAERHAAHNPALWFLSEELALDWLAEQTDLESRDWRVWKVTGLQTQDGTVVWTAEAVVTTAGALARAACMMAGVAVFAWSMGLLSIGGGA